MDVYHKNIIRLCEMPYKNLGERSTDDRHNAYFSGEEDRQNIGIGFLIHKVRNRSYVRLIEVKLMGFFCSGFSVLVFL